MIYLIVDVHDTPVKVFWSLWDVEDFLNKNLDETYTVIKLMVEDS